MNATSLPVTLDAKASVDPKTGLSVAYTLRNQSDRTIYVFDRATRFEGGGKVIVEPDRMYVLLDRDGAVRLLHVLMPTPTIRAIRQRPPVYASPVPPRGEHARNVKLALPLAEDQQFFSAEPTPDSAKVQATKVRIVVGWLEERPGLQVTKVEASTGTETNLSGGWGLPAQRLSIVDLPVEAITVLEHPAPFERYPRFI